MSDHRGETSQAAEVESVHKIGPEGAAEPDSGPLIGPGGQPLTGGVEPEGYDIPSPQGASDGEVTQAVTAFLVYQTPEGHWVATADLDVALAIQRPAHFNDFVSGCAVVEKDVALTQIVQNTVSNFLAIGQQMQQQVENSRIAQMVQQGGGLGGNRQSRRHPG